MASPLDVFRGRPVELTTPLAAAEVVRRIRRGMEKQKEVRRRRYVRGDAGDDGFLMLYCHRRNRGNGWLRVLRARVVDTETGARLFGEFRVLPIVYAFHVAALGFLGVFALVLVIGVLVGETTPWALLGFLLFLLLFGLLVTFGLYLSGTDEDALVSWLERRLRGSARPPAGP